MQPDSVNNQEAAAPAPENTAAAQQNPQSAPAPQPAATSAGNVSQEARTNAMLAWIFAPITSFVWKDEQDGFLKQHARESFYVGMAQVAVFVVLLIAQMCFNAAFVSTFGLSMIGLAGMFGLVMSLLWLAYWAFTLVPRIIGAIKANGGQTWEFKAVSDLVKRFIKL